MSAPRDLVQELDDGRTAALALLERPGRGAVGAVSVLANQLSAYTVVIAPQLPRTGVYVDLSAVTGRLHRELRALESLLSGDASHRGNDVHAAMHGVVDLARRAGTLERALATDLVADLGPERSAALLEKYCLALQRGPTRPHPGSRRGGVVGGLARRVNARRDRVMDVLDSRSVPGAHPVTEHVLTGRERRAAGLARPSRKTTPAPPTHDDAGGTS